MKAWMAVLLAGVAAGALAQSGNPYGPGSPGYNQKSFDDEVPWQELQDIAVPAFPKQENLQEFYVSAVTTNKYFVDASTLAVGADRVVRYVLVVRTSGGATNISFEGINCLERSWKHYASGHSDGTWTKSRATRVEWRPIEGSAVNRHHAALSRDLFCPAGTAIVTADEGRNALRLGKHPNSN